ncbi:MAG: hypothetical protein JO003_03910 [Candidatus Eremiobacteraeota bacterium]|nr:hypothetical protein [Candidatus Eremiobacteraeota bacterium]
MISSFLRSLDGTGRGNVTFHSHILGTAVNLQDLELKGLAPAGDAVARFARDLFEAGVGRRERAVLALRYDRALTEGSRVAWTRFYRALFSALSLLARKHRAPTWQSRFAIGSLLRILEDDLGSALYDREFTDGLRTALQPPLYLRPRATAGVVQLASFR